MTDETSDETSDLFLHKIVALTALVNVSIFYFAVFAQTWISTKLTRGWDRPPWRLMTN